MLGTGCKSCLRGREPFQESPSTEILPRTPSVPIPDGKNDQRVSDIVYRTLKIRASGDVLGGRDCRSEANMKVSARKYDTYLFRNDVSSPKRCIAGRLK